jgi:hypothetical protein
VSVLRARCPDCRTLTAVAIGPDYQCHSCGREFAAGLVRLEGGLELPWPDTGGDLPKRPLVSGGTPAEHEEIAAALAPGDYVFVDGPAEGLELRLASLPTPAGAGFVGFDDPEAVTRLAHALGL